LLSLGIAVLFAVAAAQADSLGDGRVGVQSAPPGDPPPACGSLQFSASSVGSVLASCAITGDRVTSITIAVPESESSQPGQPEGLQVVSPLTLTELAWSESCDTGTVGAVAVFECTLTAPQLPAGAKISNDGDCDVDDSTFGIPVGCDINFSTGKESSSLFFADNATLDVSTNGAPLATITPEPGTISLFALGVLMMLPGGLRRKWRQQ
jgi:hypothetical protein